MKDLIEEGALAEAEGEGLAPELLDDGEGNVGVDGPQAGFAPAITASAGSDALVFDIVLVAAAHG